MSGTAQGKVSGLRVFAVAVLCAAQWQARPAEAGVNAWTTMNITAQIVRALAIDPAAPSTVYAGTPLGGVLKSTDGGSTWVSVNVGLTSSNVWALAIDPAATSTVYAGTEGGGMFKSTDAGATWSAANTGLTSFDVQALAIDPASPSTLYAGTFGGGVFKIDQEPVFEISPPSHEFGAQMTGTMSPPQAFTVINTGLFALDIASVELSGADDLEFLTSADTCTGALLGTGSACTVDVVFAPATSGTKNAVLRFTDNAAGSPHEAALSGEGSGGGGGDGCAITPAGGPWTPALELLLVPLLLAGNRLRRRLR